MNLARKSKGDLIILEIDKKKFEALCFYQCPQEDICDYFECGIDELEEWAFETYGRDFEKIYRKYRAMNRFRLRKAQFNLSARNATLAVWLGRQFLRQVNAPPIGGGKDGDGLWDAIKEAVEGLEGGFHRDEE